MTREEIIRLAREAGFSVSWPETVVNFERFANLVAAAERETCAQVATDFWTEGYADEIVQGIAAEIRARGQDE